MFTDEPVTPLRLETLVGLLRSPYGRRLDADAAAHLLQPEEVPEAKGKRPQALATIRAARELGLIEDRNGVLALTFDRADKRPTHQIVVAAFDDKVLAATQVEPYFALFYGYLLGQGARGATKRKGLEWATDFNQSVFPVRPPNVFNDVKLSGMHRWLDWAGLGWYDPAEVFQCNPYERLRRRLPDIFGKERKLDDEGFAVSLAKACPELDGGDSFRQANPDYKDSDRRWSLGLSHALVELHLDGELRLHGLGDTRGWSVEAADPARDETLRSPRVDSVERLAREKP